MERGQLNSNYAFEKGCVPTHQMNVRVFDVVGFLEVRVKVRNRKAE